MNPVDQKASFSIPIPTLHDLCLERILSANPDDTYLEKLLCQADLPGVLCRAWNDLKLNVPKKNLGLQREINTIETNIVEEMGVTLPEGSSLPQIAYSPLFRKLASALSPYFAKAGCPLNNIRIPVSSTEFTQLQKDLTKKWKDEALVIFMSCFEEGFPECLEGLPKNFLEDCTAKDFRDYLCEPENAQKFAQIGSVSFNFSRYPENVPPDPIWHVIPPEIEYLPQTQILQMDDHQISYIPTYLNKLTQLTHIAFRNNKIFNISEKLNFSHLQDINFDGNQFTLFPECFSKCTDLTSINFDNNHISFIPDYLTKFTLLTFIGFNNNRISNLPENIQQLTRLEELYLGGNKLAYIPNWVSKLKNLQKIDLGCNKIETIPNSLSGLSNLTVLALDHNKIKTVPNSLGRLSNLTTLALGGNQLTNLPASFSAFSQMQSFGLHHNLFESLPSCVFKMTRLEELFVQNNKIKIIPKELGNLIKLKTLQLNDNEIDTIPESIKNLRFLETLLLQNNQLTSLTSLSSLNLDTLEADGNPLPT